MQDTDYMKLALELAKKGLGYVNPNPMVGAIIVKEGVIIGQGYHEKYGQLHAERNALNHLSTSPKDATLYVTLEPCCHYGKTSPCTKAIIESKIKRVVVGSTDPNPLVRGRGIKILRENNIDVTEDICKEECDKLNEVFFHYIKTKIPYVIMKYAMTMDGKIATYTGKSRWITGETARKQVHLDRHRYTAIMVGVNTVILDNPLLTCRLNQGKTPIRIICDTNLRTPLRTKLILTARKIHTIIATSCIEEAKREPYLKAGCELITVEKADGHINLCELMKQLGKMGIDSVLLEGGAALGWSALQCGIVNKLQCYISPKLFGGKGAESPIGGEGIKDPQSAFWLKNRTITQLGEDILIEGEVSYPCLQE
ncbi:diaminohydroxyphosphoribosylaminopyrimidine deaminase/5-amino-6-(5-phosphoribosylamino)uracil reductase [Lachnotalea glycerini]|uniref:Riboflavin biosynthesis protein RibD n=1 Tax=Lachnotalea glycerini TaxID=1763509 RepID=A0A318ENU6_9FIRM|nr:bifunctional diaminohydroxyphosphoribosylaminopyrimidine deaminase/5-amino-6-(5-phosphoribosylamino)uracil reductase RibD [Lachnotalea glycerini]PXV91755.1 diaminohydroxyphosphoribosylaminopyrimidine deaminase/5-amino-6-(5-phosphoribosylamino)uracil reductase [Lachnotalea glycerini]